MEIKDKFPSFHLCLINFSFGPMVLQCRDSLLHIFENSEKHLMVEHLSCDGDQFEFNDHKCCLLLLLHFQFLDHGQRVLGGVELQAQRLR
jgi:hypothetical protein